jgi:hypothetical protein
MTGKGMVVDYAEDISLHSATETSHKYPPIASVTDQMQSGTYCSEDLRADHFAASVHKMPCVPLLVL